MLNEMSSCTVQVTEKSTIRDVRASPMFQVLTHKMNIQERLYD